ncbi:MAG: DUF1329 domain-containing protein [Proteobacteria bacterium]|nr:DUF1329 domain-containing protein [Pseudomonadota bacterium]
MSILYKFKLLICSLFFLLLSGNIVQAMDLPKMINKTNCSQYKDLLIPAMYRAVERGDWVVTPGTLNFKYKHQDSFIEAGKNNAGKFDLSKDGNLIDKTTGKFAAYNIYSYPFPNIDLKDPKVADKIMWNFNFQIYRFMGSREHIYIQWIDKMQGEERYIEGLDQRLYMTGRSPGQEVKNNPDKILTYEMQRVLSPMSVKGTNTMSYIYMDDKYDVCCAYVPAIRRIRQTGSASRSDPYMGTDSWIDLNYMWNGKNSSMKWKYAGEKTILVGFSSPKMLTAKELPDGSLCRSYPYSGKHIKFGYEVPNWKGANWAPAPDSITYVPRKVWIIEQMPKDPYYNWGLHVNYVDQETYTIWYKEVYDQSGDFRIWISTFLHYITTPSGKSNTGDFDTQLYIDEKARHATTVNRSPHPESFLYIPASKISSDYFSVNNFLLLSK